MHDHDPWSVGVAALICLMATFTAFSIVEQARRSPGRRNAWLVAAGAVSGTGIWATHFVAMLAYRPHMTVGYDLGLTFLSILAAILLTGAGWWISLRPERWAPLGAGVVIGAGIATMHYIGMAALSMAGRLVYDPGLVAASVAIGIAFTAIAIAVRRKRARENPHKLPWIATLLFTLAICGMHFTGMGAARMVHDPRLATPSLSIGAESLGVAVTLIAIMILAIGLAVVLFDRKLSSRALEEAERLRSFADAAVEGLVVIDGHSIVDVNQGFLAIAGYPDSAACPRSLSMLLPDYDPDRQPHSHGAEATECRLVTAGGGECPVEILVRPLDWAGAKLRILAIRDIRERKEAAARIAHLAYHDALTGLPNRTVFAEHLARTIDKAHGQPIAVLCLDLDGFKAVNDMCGHPIGDELLVEASHRLLLAAGPDCLVSRLGGDEFAIIQKGGDQPVHAGQAAERVIASLGEQFLLEDQIVRIGCSIGIALYPGDATPAALVKNADMALYRAKAEGGRTARFYEPAMDQALRWRRQMEAELRLAIELGQLEVHYQPLADLETGAILSFEALLRWSHPTLGAISPEVFIPLAEECGYISTLGEWALRQACSEAAGWQPRLRLSVNLSPLQFMPGDLIATVERVLAETGLDASRLDLEVTEGLLIKDAETALEILAGLKALGVQISMDDFGTGYASLSYFRMFPFDKVKIDRSFVHDMMINPQARAIIRSVIGLGQGLGMPVIAEGVETQEQFDTLRAEGCDQVQGYLISRPGPIRNFERVIVKRAGAQINSGKLRRAA